MSQDDPEGLQAAAAGSLLQDMVNDSGIMPWINDLGLNGHVDKAIFISNSEDADSLQLNIDADTMAPLMHSRGGSAHDDASGGASTRGKREGASIDGPGHSKRPSRNLDYAETGVDLESQRAIQGMLHLDGDRQGNAREEGSSTAKARTIAHVNHVHDAPANAAVHAGGHGGSKFLAGVAGVRDVPEDFPPHSPADHEHVPPTPSSSGPRSLKRRKGSCISSLQSWFAFAWCLRPVLTQDAFAQARCTGLTVGCGSSVLAMRASTPPDFSDLFRSCCFRAYPSWAVH